MYLQRWSLGCLGVSASVGSMRGIRMLETDLYALVKHASSLNIRALCRDAYSIASPQCKQTNSVPVGSVIKQNKHIGMTPLRKRQSYRADANSAQLRLCTQ